MNTSSGSQGNAKQANMGEGEGEGGSSRVVESTDTDSEGQDEGDGDSESSVLQYSMAFPRPEPPEIATEFDNFPSHHRPTYYGLELANSRPGHPPRRAASVSALQIMSSYYGVQATRKEHVLLRALNLKKQETEKRLRRDASNTHPSMTLRSMAQPLSKRMHDAAACTGDSGISQEEARCQKLDPGLAWRVLSKNHMEIRKILNGPAIIIDMNNQDFCLFYLCEEVDCHGKVALKQRMGKDIPRGMLPAYHLDQTNVPPPPPFQDGFRADPVSMQGLSASDVASRHPDLSLSIYWAMDSP